MAVVSETILSLTVKELGDSILQTMTTVIYGSSACKFLVLGAAIVAFVKLGFAFRDGAGLEKPFAFFIAWSLCLQVNEKPVGFIMVNAIDTWDLQENKSRRTLSKAKFLALSFPGIMLDKIYLHGSKFVMLCKSSISSFLFFFGCIFISNFIFQI